MQSRKKHFAGALLLSFLIALALLGPGARIARAADGSYDLHWYAADPDPNDAPYLPTYVKQPPSQLSCPTPSGGVGRTNDPLQNAVAYGPTFQPSDLDAVTSLQPSELALGQVLPFELEIAVSGSTAPENGTIQFVNDWLAKTTSGKNFGFDPAYLVYCAFVDFGDVGTVDPQGDAKVDSFVGTVLDVGGNNERIEGTIKVSGLDDGDNIIVEIWVVLKSTVPADVNGNVQTSLQSAKTCTNADCSTGSTIGVGNQTVPLLQVGDFFTASADKSIVKTDSPDPQQRNLVLTYTASVTNNSTSTIANGVVVTDNLDSNTLFNSGSWPAGGGNPGGTCTHSSGTVTCNIGALSQSQTIVITISVTVLPSAPILNDPTTNPEPGAAGTVCPNPAPNTWDICNRVSVTSITADPTPGNDSYAQPTNILAAPTLGYLEKVKATARAKNVKLKWRTANELGVVGFNLYRATSKDGTFEKLNTDVIVPEFAEFGGAKYLYKDKDVVPGTKYWYQVQVMGVNGQLELSDAVRVRMPPAK